MNSMRIYHIIFHVLKLYLKKKDSEVKKPKLCSIDIKRRVLGFWGEGGKGAKDSLSFFVTGGIEAQMAP